MAAGSKKRLSDDRDVVAAAAAHDFGLASRHRTRGTLRSTLNPAGAISSESLASNSSSDACTVFKDIWGAGGLGAP